MAMANCMAVLNCPWRALPAHRSSLASIDTGSCGAMCRISSARAAAENAAVPSIDLPNPYAAGVRFGQLPEGRQWGGVIAVTPDRDGRSIWAFERCGGSCLNSDLPAVLEFDPSGKLIKSFGAGMFVFPHGIAVDKDGNVYVADADGKNGKGCGRQVQPRRQGIDDLGPPR